MAFLPPPKLTISEWADQHRFLSPESSAEPGRWRTRRTPYLKEIMDSVNLNETTVVMASSQVGKTEVILNTIGYFVDQDPAPLLSINPTLEMAETFSKDRIVPMVRDSPNLREKIDVRSRRADNTILHKKFPGGHITMLGANSPTGLAGRPIRVVICDETDRNKSSAGDEGDPITLAVKRTTTFWNRRILLVSTPGTKGISRIEEAFKESDQRRYFVTCPHCTHAQILRWEQVKWEESDPSGAWYECENCGDRIETRHKPNLLKTGEWRAMGLFRGIAGFHLNELYSPWKTFGDVVLGFLAAKDNPERLRVWVNTSLGESYDEEKGEELKWQQLYENAGGYELLTVPMGGLLLTAGVDVQGDRVVVSVWAWGVGEECWLIYHQEIKGDPSQAQVWEDLDSVLLAKYSHASGVELGISATAIDTGFKTQDVYNFVRTRQKRHVMAIKGMNTQGKPVIGRPTLQDVSFLGKVLKRGLKLFPVGSDTAKGIIYGRLRTPGDGPGCIHFPRGLEEEYFAQLTAEKLVTKLVKLRPRREWVKTRARNEALDTFVYAYAAASAIGLSRMDWVKLAEKVEKMKDKKEPPEKRKEEPKAQSQVTEQPLKPFVPKLRSGQGDNFATRW